MVSVAIFSVIMVISLGALLSISSAERKAETLKSVMDNLNFALESMSRTIRTGVNYNCGSPSGGDCASSGSNYFSFQAADGTFVAYCLDGTSIKREIVPSGGTLDTICSSPGFLPITAPEVSIGTLAFYLVGSAANDNIQPKLTIVVIGSAQITAAQSTTFHIETSVAQRIYDQ